MVSRGSSPIVFERTAFYFWMSFSVWFVDSFFSFSVCEWHAFFSYPSSGMQIVLLCTRSIVCFALKQMFGIVWLYLIIFNKGNKFSSAPK